MTKTQLNKKNSKDDELKQAYQKVSQDEERKKLTLEWEKSSLKDLKMTENKVQQEILNYCQNNHAIIRDKNGQYLLVVHYSFQKTKKAFHEILNDEWAIKSPLTDISQQICWEIKKESQAKNEDELEQAYRECYANNPRLLKLSEQWEQAQNEDWINSEKKSVNMAEQNTQRKVNNLQKTETESKLRTCCPSCLKRETYDVLFKDNDLQIGEKINKVRESIEKISQPLTSWSTKSEDTEEWNAELLVFEITKTLKCPQDHEFKANYVIEHEDGKGIKNIILDKIAKNIYFKESFISTYKIN